MTPRRFLPAAIAFTLALPAYGYPEFQQFVKKNSGRGTNCAMCHVHPDGPEGLKPGQIGSLSTEELNQLNRARAAFEPGQNAHNPILNAFGDSIINTLGKTKFLQIRLHPEELPEALGDTSDLDRDGIPDSKEYIAGTHPLDDSSGEPASLFLINLRRYAFHLVMMVVATGAGLYGLNAMLHWFDLLMSSGRDKDASEK
ncbi:MAG: hypothetical protein IT364_06585 [Candidatus Hydrogenedentes bacterium]|nr:hypothetical protein [Candidatus Hydrogenedentota bacterium]